MKTFFKHLKKHTLTIILVIIFLFIQAMCDLSLPDYTSKIVDIGITQNGIEDNVPEEIKEKELNKLKLFLTKEEKTIIEENYDLKENTYYLKNINQDTRTNISNILINPEMAVQMIESENQNKNDIF